MAWFALIVAGLLETFGVAMMNQWSVSRSWKPLSLFVLGFASSLILLHYSMNFIAMGTAYAIWTGIGVIGGTIVGMIFYGESKDWKRILFISIILISVIGLKIIDG